MTETSERDPRTISEHYVKIGDMTWPRPNTELEWQLRYGPDTSRYSLVAASYVAAYDELIRMPEKRRNERVRQIRKAAQRGDS